MANTVTIQFGAKGDRDVIDAINKLDASTKKLIATQVKLTASSKSQVRQMTASQKTMTGMLAKLKAVDLNFKKIGVSTKVLTKAYEGNRIAIEKVRIAIRKYKDEQGKADVATRILGGTFAVLRSKLLLASFAMGTILRPLSRIIGESARVKNVSTAFSTLSGSMSNASVAVGKLEKATDGTMTKFDLFKQANNAMILGVTKNSDEMAEMFDMAQRLGEALGRDTASSVESLITGIGRQSRLMLDNIGIIVDSDKAYKDYAKQLKKNASDLTDAEKKQAFLNATLESARQKVKGLPPEVETASKIFKVFGVQLNDLGASIGTTLTPIAVGLTKLFTSLVRGIDAGVDALNAFFGLDDDSRTIEGVNIQLKELQDELLNLQSIDTHAGGMLEGLGGESREQKIQQEIDNLNKIKTSLQKLAEERNEADKKQIESETNKAQALKDSQELELTVLQTRLEFLRNNTNLLKQGLDIDERRILLNKEEQKITHDQKKGLIDEFEARKQLLDIKIKEAELDAEQQSKTVENAFASANMLMSSFSNVTQEYKKQIASRENAELQTLRNTHRYKKASTEEQKKMEQSVTAKFADEKLKIFRMEKASNVAQIITNTATAVMKAYSQLGAFGVPVATFIAGLGAFQLKQAMSVEPPTFESGGLIGGRRHSQGGTLIEAEQGEFVMSRNAVQSIGVETLNQMNRSGTSGVTVNISAPLVDDSVVDSIIPAINKALRSGRANIGE